MSECAVEEDLSALGRAARRRVRDEDAYAYDDGDAKRGDSDSDGDGETGPLRRLRSDGSEAVRADDDLHIALV